VLAERIKAISKRQESEARVGVLIARCDLQKLAEIVRTDACLAKDRSQRPYRDCRTVSWHHHSPCAIAQLAVTPLATRHLTEPDLL
jgi:hypothetical protein